MRNYDEFEKGLMEAFKYDRKVVLESNIEGFEIGCAVVGNEDLLIGEVDEIDTKNDFLTMWKSIHSIIQKFIVLPA